jgi:hypothetical protein
MFEEKSKDKEYDIEYTMLNDSKNAHFYFEETSVRFNEIVKVISFKQYKKVAFKEMPEIVCIIPKDDNILSFIYNLNYEIKCTFRYYYNNIKENLSNNLYGDVSLCNLPSDLYYNLYDNLNNDLSGNLNNDLSRNLTDDILII